MREVSEKEMTVFLFENPDLEVRGWVTGGLFGRKTVVSFERNGVEVARKILKWGGRIEKRLLRREGTR